MAKPIKLRKQPPTRRITLSAEFVTSLARIKNYGEKTFGKIVSDRFIKEVRRQISMLGKQPDANPKNRFIESTARKTYRNIICEKYCVLYSVTATVIDVIEMYHTAQSPEHIKTLA